MIWSIQYLLFVVSFRKIVKSYPTGAVDYNLSRSACVRLIPEHGNHLPKNDSFPPFSIILSSRTYSAKGGKVNVTLVGSQDFKGFIIQARDRVTNYPGGHFENYSPDIRPVDCTPGMFPSGNNSLTHTSPIPKRMLTFTWIAPDLSFNPSLNPPPMVFLATIVQNFSTFWTELTSDVIIPVYKTDFSSGNPTNSQAALSMPQSLDQISLPFPQSQDQRQIPQQWRPLVSSPVNSMQPSTILLQANDKINRDQLPPYLNSERIGTTSSPLLYSSLPSFYLAKAPELNSSSLEQKFFNPSQNIDYGSTINSSPTAYSFQGVTQPSQINSSNTI